jgi:hypothetical protein
MLFSKQKLFMLINAIDEKLAERPTKSSFRFNITGNPSLLVDPTIFYDEEELTNQLLKLEKDEKILHLLHYPKNEKETVKEEDIYWELQIEPDAYTAYVRKLQRESDYHEFPFIRKFRELAEISESKTDIVYEITYTDGGNVLLNKVFQLAKTDFNKENDLVFSLLYENPNKLFTVADIKRELGTTLDKSLNKIVENLGFTGDIRKVFMNVSKDSIKFRNPITRSDLEKIGIDMIRLPR